MDDQEYIFRGVFDQIKASCQHLYDVLGPGHAEIVYHKALALELREMGIEYESEKRILVTYISNKVEHTLSCERMDLYLPNYKCIIELKANASEIRPMDIAQLLKYFRARGKIDAMGVIINFPQASTSKDADGTIKHYVKFF